jgi:hypothetical protein
MCARAGRLAQAREAAELTARACDFRHSSRIGCVYGFLYNDRWDSQGGSWLGKVFWK